MAGLKGTLVLARARLSAGLGYPVFVSGEGHGRVVVLLSGMGEGPLSLGYTEELCERLDRAEWGLALPYLASSWRGIGVSSLDEDARLVVDACRCLSSVYGVREVVVMGHSTGAQGVVAVARLLAGMREQGDPYEPLPEFAGCILQGAVSDRDWATSVFGAAEMERCIKGARKVPPEQVLKDSDLPSAAGGEVQLGRYLDTPLSAGRFLSLYAKGGDDDMFSDDLNEQELGTALHWLRAYPSLIVLSGADEYCVDTMTHDARLQRFAAAASSASGLVPAVRTVVLDGAVHCPRGVHATSLCNQVVDFVTNGLALS